MTIKNLSFNFHLRTGLRPGFAPEWNKYGRGKYVLIIRLWWSAATVTWASSK
jgi:hypothetical protein